MHQWLRVCFCMKSSVKDHRRISRATKCLIVDGYNVLPRIYHKALDQIDNLEFARQELVHQLSEYRSYCGEHVVLVFDAHHTLDVGVHQVENMIDIYFTDYHETADQKIERLVYDLSRVYREITVATSDNAEQQVAFGGGALRISAEELLRRLENVKSEISGKITDKNMHSGQRVMDNIRQDLVNILEKWRRQ